MSALLNDWSAGPGALHRKLAAALEKAIRDGELRGGQRLPSERALAKRLVLSRSTVVAAYASLVSAGMAESRHGSGTYVRSSTGPGESSRVDVAGAATPLFQRLLADGDGRSDVISFASARVPVPTALARAVEAAVKEDFAPLTSTSGYQPLGLRSLREAVADVFCQRGVPTTAEQVLITTGAHQALNLCAAVFARPGDWVALEDPTYPGVMDAFAAAGARLAPVEVDGEGVVPDSLAEVLRGRSVAAICVTPTFHNPTGAVLPEYRRRRLVELAADHGAPIVEDLALAHATLSDTDPPPPLAAYCSGGDPPVVSVGSASKMFWSGLRVGWVRAPEPWLGRLARRKVAADLGSALIDQAVAARMFSELRHVEAEVRQALQLRLDACEQALRNGFDGWTWRSPEGGASLWVHLPDDAARFAQVALRYGVDLIPGNVFSTGERWSDYLRIPFALEPEMLDVALDRLRSAWAAYKPDAVIERRLDDPALVV